MNISNLFQIFEDVLEVKKKKLNLNSSINNLKSWDSVSHINIIIEIEKKFKKKINPDQASNLTSIKKIKKFLKI
jgi:acyl carrier protein